MLYSTAQSPSEKLGRDTLPYTPNIMCLSQLSGGGRGWGEGGDCDPPALTERDKGSVKFSPPGSGSGRRGEEIAGHNLWLHKIF